MRLLLSSLVLAVPTLLMGGTLPAAARAAETPEDVRRRALAVLYGLNTLGAVAGAGASTFLLFEVFGTRTTLWLACLLNVLVALIARAVARGLPELPVSPAESPASGAALAAAQGHRAGAKGVDDPTVYLELEEQQGLYHSARQASSCRRSWTPRRAHCSRVLRA